MSDACRPHGFEVKNKQDQLKDSSRTETQMVTAIESKQIGSDKSIDDYFKLSPP